MNPLGSDEDSTSDTHHSQRGAAKLLAQIFPIWANRLPLWLALAVPAGAGGAIAAATFFFSPRFTDVGYQPPQPIAFSHRLHVSELEVDCRYCHQHVEEASVASLPTTATCMNCHSLIGRKNPRLALLRASEENGEPIRWVRVHRLPDYTVFDHGAHLRANIDCSSCHGDVDEMRQMRQAEPLSMRWCLDCHRDNAEAALSPPTDCTGCHQ